MPLWKTVSNLHVQMCLMALLQKESQNSDLLTLVYITITCGITPCLYYLGMADNRGLAEGFTGQ